jgi:hypothetical protein
VRGELLVLGVKAGCRARFLIRDRTGREVPALFGAVVAGEGHHQAAVRAAAGNSAVRTVAASIARRHWAAL